MIIDKDEVPNALILNYCRVIKLMEGGSNEQLDHVRQDLHDKIFKVTKHDRALYGRADREFSRALNETVIDLTKDMEE